jgi:hypothetical protein
MENQRPLPAALVEKLAMGYIGVKLKPDSGVPLPETIKSPPALCNNRGQTTVFAARTSGGAAYNR